MATAKIVDIPPVVSEEIVNERRPISPDVAVRLGKLFGNGPGIWIRMQAAYDTWHAERRVDTSAIPTIEAA